MIGLALAPLTAAIEAQPTQQFVAKSAKLTGLPTGDGGSAVQVDFMPHVDYSGFDIVPNKPWDWSELDEAALLLEVSNPGPFSIHLYVAVKTADGGFGTRSVNIPVGFHGNLSYPLQSPALTIDSGLRDDPSPWLNDNKHLIWMWGSPGHQLDLSAVSMISVYVNENVDAKQLLVHDVMTAVDQPRNREFLTGIVDEFGQNAREDFPLKVHSTEELRMLAAAELDQLAQRRPPAGRSRFGGWKSGPKLEATGFFRTAKVDGRWWLIDPEGYLYFASGIANIRMENTTTVTGIDFRDDSIRTIDPDDTTPEDSRGIVGTSSDVRSTRYVTSPLRHNMFASLPDYDDPLAQHYSYRRSVHTGPVPHGETFSFYQANLERRYGADFWNQWLETTVNRMLDWGFTCLGNWTDADFFDNGRMPYFANGWIIGDFKTVTSGHDIWSPLPDVFDPVFEERARITVAEIAANVKDSPWCVGVFIDNEKSWGRTGGTVEQHYGIVINTLKLPVADSPSKAAFTAALQQQYGKIKKLNRAWGIKLDSWDEFFAGVTITKHTPKAVEDYSMLLKLYASKYFEIVDAALDEVLPNHLYMGVRMAHWGMTPEVVEACKKYTDVISYNCYKEGLITPSWEFLAEIDMPSIIGEFHVGATSDTGLYHPGLIHATDQADRARMYEVYMNTVLASPYFVGAHWFQYIDSPITGRAYDGENYNVGFVGITDVPYPEMINKTREFHRDLYEKRLRLSESAVK